MHTKTISEDDKSEAGTISSISCFSVVDCKKINPFDKLMDKVESKKMDTITACRTTCVSKVHKAGDGRITGFSKVDGEKINPSKKLLNEMENKIDIVTVCNTPCVSKIDKAEDGSIACVMEVDGEEVDLCDKLTVEMESKTMDADVVCNTICVSKDEKVEAAEDDSEEINHFDKLPNEVIENIFSFITYHEVSVCREVCRRFNNLAKGVLNRGYYKARTSIIKCMEEIKNQLPRRESERSKHRLYKKHNILSGIEPRFNLLGMTYLKFIEGNYTCFIPGKVLDELFKVIRHVMNEPYIVNCSQLTQELRDLILMAIEDFDDNIYPYLKYKYDPAHTQANDFFWDGIPRSRDPLLKKSPEGWIKIVDDNSLELLENKIAASESKLEEVMNKVRESENKLEQLTNQVKASERKLERLESLASNDKVSKKKIKQLETLSHKVAASESKLSYLEKFLKSLREDHNASVQKMQKLNRTVSGLEKEQNKQENATETKVVQENYNGFTVIIDPHLTKDLRNTRNATETKVVQENYNGFTVIIDPHLTKDLRNTRNNCPDLKRIQNSCPDTSDDSSDSSDIYDTFKKQLNEPKINWKLPIKNDKGDDDFESYLDKFTERLNKYTLKVHKHIINWNLTHPTRKIGGDNVGLIDDNVYMIDDNVYTIDDNVYTVNDNASTIDDYGSGDSCNMFNQRISKRKINWNWKPLEKKVKYN